MTSGHLYIDYSSLKFIGGSFQDKKNGVSLGKIHKASYMNKIVKVRRIGKEGKKMSPYMFEQVYEEFSEFRALGNAYLESHLGVGKTESFIFVVSEFYPYNLVEYINRFAPNIENKLRIFLNIVTAIETMHSDNMAHGH